MLVFHEPSLFRLLGVLLLPCSEFLLIPLPVGTNLLLLLLNQDVLSFRQSVEVVSESTEPCHESKMTAEVCGDSVRGEWTSVMLHFGFVGYLSPESKSSRAPSALETCCNLCSEVTIEAIGLMSSSFQRMLTKA